MNGSRNAHGIKGGPQTLSEYYRLQPLQRPLAGLFGGQMPRWHSVGGGEACHVGFADAVVTYDTMLGRVELLHTS